MPFLSLPQIFERNRAQGDCGIYAVCSAHPLVIRAALELAQQRGQVALIEATCNQVNQFGGYTGLQPKDFAAMVRGQAQALGMPAEQLVLGGDHLGPQPWTGEPAASAMAKAVTLVHTFVAAGFSKIHLDCSMRCADDPAVLPESTIAERAAKLAQAAESARDGGSAPLYIIGTEVPPPGGMGSGHEIVPTAPGHVAQTFATHQSAFASLGQDAAFSRVVGMVVQPGLDFGNEAVVAFKPADADALSAALADYPKLVFEAHSTDYQQGRAYRDLVAAHFAILKVGPAATFALREALYALEAVEAELIPQDQRSGLRTALEAAMLAEPDSWSRHYAGTPEQQKFLRHFSYSDRLRYYWTAPAVDAAVKQLMENLRAQTLPLPLLSQFLPVQAQAIAAGQLRNEPEALAIAAVQGALAPYSDACGEHHS